MKALQKQEIYVAEGPGYAQGSSFLQSEISLCLYVTVQFATKSFISTAISLVLAYGFHSESRCSSKAHCSQADDQVNELLSKFTLNPAPSTEAQAIDIALRLERHVKQ